MLSDIYHWIRKWAIRVNQKKYLENKKIQLNDEITFDDKIIGWLKKNPLLITASKQNKKHNISLDEIKKQIIREDEHRIFWNKPAWIVIHEGNFHENDINLNELLETYCAWQHKQLPQKKESDQPTTFKPSFGFRLDKDTSWVIVWAKTYEALQYINQMIRERRVSKKYCCIVNGHITQTVVAQEPLFKWFNATYGRAQTFVNHDKGLPSKTVFIPVKHVDLPWWGSVTVMVVQLYTGRMHQIRVHAAYHGFAIAGDMMYGDDLFNKFLAKRYKITRQLLHSYEYGFEDPRSHKQLIYQADLPSDFIRVAWDIQIK